MTQRINPAALQSLKEALTLAYWYKNDLRPFLATSIDDRALVAALDWSGYKRNIVYQLVDSLAAKVELREQLIDLMLATSDINDPHWLKRVDDGPQKYDDAAQALNALRRYTEPIRRQRSETQEAERRRREDEARVEVQRAIREKLIELNEVFRDLAVAEPHKRGYALEPLLTGLFALFDIDTKSSFRIVGEQIDGAFTFEGTEFLAEARWRDQLTPPADLDAFSGKVSRKLDNTLGLFISINGFQPTAVALHSQSRSLLLCMDGSDLSAVLEDRIGLPELLTRKRQHAARTGEIMISAYSILG
ncbi:MAG TPA: hypothetical protein VJA46_13095 [Acidimicrobiia bacterium]|nr:hypothetical protein [Acidimicrobiia bacterium]